MGYGFQTPPEVAAAMLALADREPATILEPCSGRGTLVAAAKAAFPRAEITSVEIDGEYCREQAAAGLRVAQLDFFGRRRPTGSTTWWSPTRRTRRWRWGTG
jgi:methylase of polypeptide subunit release factors